MLVERQGFLDSLHLLSGEGPQVLDEQQAHLLVEQISLAFALYEKELIDRTDFLITKLGELTVVHDAEVARLVAADALKEAEYRWE